ncbi:hypothetical protein BKA62DRAFT_806677 [Auriculariales sp. MPI-PUGE-AT-0066]|nr:hypothetical protein BKA62DRAFT_806677 [Auriculariales sp. MPI-PUGE-AT-0066]
MSSPFKTAGDTALRASSGAWGIASISKYDLLTRLQSKLEDTKKRGTTRHHVRLRDAAVDSWPLVRTLRRWRVLNLLAAFGDPQADVREATQDAAKDIMSGLSGYGVKLIFPSCWRHSTRRNGETRRQIHQENVAPAKSANECQEP